MGKKLSIIILTIATISLLNGCVSTESGQDILSVKELSLEDIQDKIIRFHVLANSDTDEDQALKFKVRDRVIEVMSSKLIDCIDAEEAREIMLDSMDEVNAIATKVIEENGYSYTVRCEISRENFPDKMYGDMLFPQGEYEAFRILIGEANGQNWWCVMFPPLCFVDETKQAVNSEETKESLDNVIAEDDKIENSGEKRQGEKGNKNKDTEKKEKVEFKFKLFEIFKGK